MRRWAVRAGVVGVLFFMAGCSEPPTKEHDQAVAAIAAARLAGALTYATDELAAAEASLKRYDDFVGQRDFKQALNAALDARDRAFEAATSSAATQQSLSATAGTLLASLDAALGAAETQLKTPVTRTASRLADKLRQTRAASAKAMQEARTELKSGDLKRANQKLVAASAALKRDSDALSDAIRKTRK